MRQAWRQIERIGVERGAWILLGLLALVCRLATLGRRPLSYDEGVHAFLSWRLAESGAYFHSPVTHGPVLYYLDALVFRLLGAGDFTSRLMPALAGLALALLPLLFRRWIGRGQALAVGAILAFSPLLIFYSRYLRSDIYIALLCTLWIWACFRYLERRDVRALYGFVLFSSLAVATKEIAFIFIAMMTGWLLFIAVRDESARARAKDLVFLHVTLFLPFAAPLGIVALASLSTLAQIRAVPLDAAVCVALGGLAAAGLALVWSRRRGDESPIGLPLWLRLAALAWGTEALYFSTFLENPAGLVSGFFGSVGYWLTQQPVGRGGQPWFFYLLLLLLYEFLPLLLAALSAAVRVRRWRQRTILGRTGAAMLQQDRIWWFCFYWTCASLVAYTLAGEKMPWLAVHIIVPLAWLAGDGFRTLAGALRTARLGAAGLLAVSPLLLLATVSLLQTGQEAADALERTRIHAGWLGAAVGIASVGLVLLGTRPWRGSLGRWSVAGLVGLAALLWLRAGWMLNFVNAESPTEPAVFAHADPEIRTLLERLNELEASDVVRVTSDVAYPARWYLRRLSDVGEAKSLKAALDSPARFVLTRFPLGESERRLLQGRSLSQEFPYLCWPDDGYKSLTARDLSFRHWGRRFLYGWWKAFFLRDYRGLPGSSHSHRWFVVLVDSDRAPLSRDFAGEPGGRP